MGRVYRALDRLTGEVIALKLLHRAEPQERLRFAREARALADRTLAEDPHLGGVHQKLRGLIQESESLPSTA